MRKKNLTCQQVHHGCQSDDTRWYDEFIFKLKEFILYFILLSKDRKEESEEETFLYFKWEMIFKYYNWTNKYRNKSQKEKHKEKWKTQQKRI